MSQAVPHRHLRRHATPVIPAKAGIQLLAPAPGFPLARDERKLGFCNRTTVTAIRRAPLGDPLEFFLRGYYVSLRKEEARCILVSVIPSAPREETAGSEA